MGIQRKKERASPRCPRSCTGHRDALWASKSKKREHPTPWQSGGAGVYPTVGDPKADPEKCPWVVHLGVIPGSFVRDGKDWLKEGREANKVGGEGWLPLGSWGPVPLGHLRSQETVPLVPGEARAVIHRPSRPTVQGPLLGCKSPVDLPTEEPAGAGESTQVEGGEGTFEDRGHQCARN